MTAYQQGKRVGKREGWSGISTPAMTGGTQNPYEQGTAEYAEWIRGFKDGATEKEQNQCK